MILKTILLFCFLQNNMYNQITKRKSIAFTEALIYGRKLGLHFIF